MALAQIRALAFRLTLDPQEFAATCQGSCSNCGSTSDAADFAFSSDSLRERAIAFARRRELQVLLFVTERAAVKASGQQAHATGPISAESVIEAADSGLGMEGTLVELCRNRLPAIRHAKKMMSAEWKAFLSPKFPAADWIRWVGKTPSASYTVVLVIPTPTYRIANIYTFTTAPVRIDDPALNDLHPYMLMLLRLSVTVLSEYVRDGSEYALPTIDALEVRACPVLNHLHENIESIRTYLTARAHKEYKETGDQHVVFWCDSSTAGSSPVNGFLAVCQPHPTGVDHVVTARLSGPPAMVACPACQTLNPSGTLTCPKCGFTRSGLIACNGLAGIVCLLIAMAAYRGIESALWRFAVCFVTGALGFLLTCASIVQVIVALKHPGSPRE